MKIQDDRTPEEITTHPVLIGGTDRFMSGWGGAAGGASFAFWACKIDDECELQRWVESRGDIMRVRQVSRDYRPKGCAHCHIYVVGEEHPAIERTRVTAS